MSTKLSVIKLQQWIETTINYELTTDSLYKALQSGVVLCKLIKKISGEKFDYHKITRGSDYKEEANFEIFCEQCSKLNINVKWTRNDLIERTNTKEILSTLNTLKEYQESKQKTVKNNSQSKSSSSEEEEVVNKKRSPRGPPRRRKYTAFERYSAHHYSVQARGSVIKQSSSSDEESSNTRGPPRRRRHTEMSRYSTASDKNSVHRSSSTPQIIISQVHVPVQRSNSLPQVSNEGEETKLNKNNQTSVRKSPRKPRNLQLLSTEQINQEKNNTLTIPSPRATKKVHESILKLSIRELVDLAKVTKDVETEQQIVGVLQKRCKEGINEKDSFLIRILEKAILELAEFGGIEVLYEYLNSEDKVVRRRATAAVCNISANDNVDNILRKSKFIEVLIKILSESNLGIHTTKIINNTSAAILNISLNGKNRYYMLTKINNTIPSILTACNNFRENSSIISNLLIALSSLALNPDGADAMRKDGLHVVIDILFTSSDTEVLEAALAALWNLSLDDDIRKVLVRNKRLKERLTELKSCNIDQFGSIIHNAEKILQIFSTFNEKEHDSEFSHLIDNLQSEDDEKIKKAATKICELCKDDVKNQLQFREQGGVHELVAILESTKDKEITEKIASAIFVLCEKYSQLLTDLEIMDILLEKLQIWHKEKLIVITILSVIMNLLHIKKNEQILRESEYLSTIISLLEISDPIIQEKAARIIVRLALEDKQGIIRETGGLAKLVDLIKKQTKDTLSDGMRQTVRDLWTLALDGTETYNILTKVDRNLKILHANEGIMHMVQLLPNTELEVPKTPRGRHRGSKTPRDNSLKSPRGTDQKVSSIQTHSNDKPVNAFAFKTEISKLSQRNTATKTEIVKHQTSNLEPIHPKVETKSQGFSNQLAKRQSSRLISDLSSVKSDYSTKTFSHITSSIRTSSSGSTDELMGPELDELSCSLNETKSESDTTITDMTPRISDSPTCSMIKLPLKLRKRNDLIFQLYNTEKEFVSQLVTAMELSVAKLPEDVHNTLFQDLDMIKMINRDFFTDLHKSFEAHKESSTLHMMEIGKLLLKRAATFRLYTTYANNLQQNLNKFETYQKHEKYKYLLASIDRDLKEKKQIILKSVLMKPMERIEFYCSLSKKIAVQTDKEHLDYIPIVQAYKQIKTISEYCKLKAKEMEQAKLLKTESQKNPISQTFNRQYHLVSNLGFNPSSDRGIHQEFLKWKEKKMAKQDETDAVWKKYNGPITRERLKKMIRKYGISPERRPEIWMVISGAAAKMKENYSYYKKMIDTHSQKSTTFDFTDADLERTFQDHPFFADKRSPVFAMMRRILVVYSWRNRMVSYCKSFNFIVGILLLHLREEEAFWLFVTIVENILPQNFYDSNLTGLLVDSRVLDHFVDERLPKIAKHFKKLKFQLANVSFGWMLRLFVTVLPMETTMRIWDSLFCEGTKIIFQVILALLKMNEKAILKTKNESEMMMLLNRIPELAFDEHGLIKTVFSFTKVDYQLEVLRKKYAPLIERNFHDLKNGNSRSGSLISTTTKKTGFAARVRSLSVFGALRKKRESEDISSFKKRLSIFNRTKDKEKSSSNTTDVEFVQQQIREAENIDLLTFQSIPIDNFEDERRPSTASIHDVQEDTAENMEDVDVSEASEEEIDLPTPAQAFTNFQ